jgi:hypothetical protein
MVQGQAGHEALATWLEQGEAEAQIQYSWAWNRLVEPALAVLRDDDPERARLAYHRTARIVSTWMDDRPKESWPLVVQPGHTELPVSHVFGEWRGLRVVFVALLDALGKRRTGGLWSIDHKFRKSITDWWKEKNEDASQFTGQLWLGAKWDLPLAGVWVNAIEIPPAKVSKSKCREHGVPYTECDTTHVRHVLFPVTRSRIEIAAWYQTMLTWVQRWMRLRTAITTLDDISRVPMEGRFNGSCTFCGFRLWCRAGRPVGGRGDWFVSQTWDPLAERRASTQPTTQPTTQLDIPPTSVLGAPHA